METVNNRKDKILFQVFKPLPATVIDSKRAWLVVASAFWNRLLFDGISFSYGITLRQLLEEFPDQLTLATVPGSVHFGTIIMFGLIWSMAVRRLTLITVGWLGALLAVGGLLASSFATNIPVLIVTFGLVSGTGAGMVLFVSDISVPRFFNDKLGLAFGLASAGSGLGMIVFPIIEQSSAAQLHWRWIFRIVGFAAISTFVTVLAFKPIENNHPETNPTAEASTPTRNDDKVLSPKSKNSGNTAHGSVANVGCIAKEHTYSRPTITHIMRDCIRESVLNMDSAVIAISTFFAMIGNLIPVFFLVTDADEGGFSFRQSALLITYMGVTNTAARLLMGYLITHMSTLNMVMIWLVSRTVAGMLQALLSFYSSTYVGYVVFAVLHGLSIGVDDTLPLTTLVRLCPRFYDSAFGLSQLGYGIAALITGPVGGVIVENTAGYMVLYLAGGLSLVLGAAFLIYVYFIERLQYLFPHKSNIIDKN